MDRAEQDPSALPRRIGWFTAGCVLVSNVVAGLVFAWVYLKVAGSFASGVSGGATMGFYAGVLVNFPSAIFLSVVLQNFPYALSWLWVVAGIVFYVIAGAIAGALNRR